MLLDFLFGEKKTEEQKALEATLVLPVDLNEAHSYAAPPIDGTLNEYPVKVPYGVNTWAPGTDKSLPVIKNQDAILVHYLQPPADKPPNAWYEDRSEAKIEMGKQEFYQTRNFEAESSSEGDVYQPWHHTPKSPRPTSTQSPSNYRFVRPFDQRFQRNLSGQSGSAATLHQSYPIGGMKPAPSWRNTLRMEPTRWDIENFDTSAYSVPAPTPAVYISPAATLPSQNQFWGLR